MAGLYRRREGAGEVPLTPVTHPEHDPSCPGAYDGDDDAPCSCEAALSSGRPPSPSFWPGDVRGGEPGYTDREEIGPIGAGTPHARMKWFWARMEPHQKLIEDLTGWNPLSSKYRFEAAVADAFDKLAEERRDG